MAGADDQQAHDPIHILCHKQRCSHIDLSYMSPEDRFAVESPVPIPWRVSESSHGDPASPSQGQPFPVALADALSFPVQFSKEKYILDSSPEKLHKELEEELKLSSTDLRSHAWYHGRIPREVRRGRWVAVSTLCLDCSGTAPQSYTKPAACPPEKPLGEDFTSSSCLLLPQKMPSCGSEPGTWGASQCPSGASAHTS